MQTKREVMRAAMTRRTLASANEAIDEADSPVDGLEDGTLSIDSQTAGNIKGLALRPLAHCQRTAFTQDLNCTFQTYGIVTFASDDVPCPRMAR